MARALWLIGWLLGAGAAWADAEPARVRAAVAAGRILPMERLLGEVGGRFPGRILKVEVEEGEGGEPLWVYEVKILRADGVVVEDDRAMALQVARALRGAGYAVDLARDGEEGHFRGSTEPYDAVVLDLGLPGLGGINLLERWRGAGLAMPVLILSARDTWREKVTGLRAGADDYLAKPFVMEELLARLEALVRRSHGLAAPVVGCGPLQLEVAAQRVLLHGRPLTLTALEYRMLAYLLHHAEAVVSKTELVEHLYERDGDRDSNVVEVMINRLRNKIGAGHIRTHRGRGYRLTAHADDP